MSSNHNQVLTRIIDWCAFVNSYWKTILEREFCIPKFSCCWAIKPCEWRIYSKLFRVHESYQLHNVVNERKTLHLFERFANLFKQLEDLCFLRLEDNISSDSWSHWIYLAALRPGNSGPDIAVDRRFVTPFGPNSPRPSHLTLLSSSNPPILV